MQSIETTWVRVKQLIMQGVCRERVMALVERVMALVRKPDTFHQTNQKSHSRIWPGTERHVDENTNSDDEHRQR